MPKELFTYKGHRSKSSFYRGIFGAGLILAITLNEQYHDKDMTELKELLKDINHMSQLQKVNSFYKTLENISNDIGNSSLEDKIAICKEFDEKSKKIIKMLKRL